MRALTAEVAAAAGPVVRRPDLLEHLGDVVDPSVGGVGPTAFVEVLQ